MKRRNFVRNLASAIVLTQVAWLSSAFSAVKKVMGLDSKTPDPRSKNFKYYSNVAKAPKELVKTKKAMAKGKKTTCDNCALYAKHAEKGFGLCPPFFQADLVNDKGFCATWSPKA